MFVTELVVPEAVVARAPKMARGQFFTIVYARRWNEPPRGSFTSTRRSCGALGLHDAAARCRPTTVSATHEPATLR